MKAYTTLALRGSILTLSFLIAGIAQPSHAGEKSWQQQMLFEPTASQLTMERKGRIFIYDGMPNAVVQTAMDQHFERIQHMMFTRVRHPPKTPGQPEKVEDDGCE